MDSPMLEYAFFEGRSFRSPTPRSASAPTPCNTARRVRRHPRLPRRRMARRSTSSACRSTRRGCSTRPSSCAPSCPSPRVAGADDRRPGREERADRRRLHPPLHLQVVRAAHPAPSGLDDELAIYMLQLGDYLDTRSGSERDRLLLAARSGQRRPGPGQALRRLHQLGAGQGRGRGEGRRRGDPARTARATSPRGAAATSSSCATARSITAAHHRRHPGRDHPPHDDAVRPATRASRSRSARSTAPSSTSSTRRSSAAPASRSPRSPASTGAPSATADPARSPCASGAFLRHRPRPIDPLRRLDHPRPLLALSLRSRPRSAGSKERGA